MSGRIDTHQHIVPPVWRSHLVESAYFGGKAIPEWSPAAAVEFLDRSGIDTAVVSVSRPGVFTGDASQAKRLAQGVNDYAEQLAQDNPGRFAYFITLPFPDMEASLREIDRCFTHEHARGVVLLSNIAGSYVGEAAFDPILEELNRRAAVLFVHPTHPTDSWVRGVPPYVVDFLLDTTRVAALIAANQVVSRFPNLRIILSHGGGFVPYAAERIAQLLPDPEGGALDRVRVLDDLRSLYYDTALSAVGAGRASLLEFAHPERLLFGSDWPYGPGHSTEYFVEASDVDGLHEQTRQNALRLFGAPSAALGSGPDRPHHESKESAHD